MQVSTTAYDPKVARTRGILAGRGAASTADMWLAACCIRHQLPLATPNQKDFVDFRQDGLDLVEPPE